MNAARCAVCREPLSADDRFCRICLEPRHAQRQRRKITAAYVLLPLLFLGTCCGFVPLGSKIADPTTNRPLAFLPEARFPILVMRGGEPHVALVNDVRRIPPLPPGSSYLVPAGREKAIEAAITAQAPRDWDGSWKLRVKPLTPQRQRIELFRIHDGYRGGAYDATTTSVTPRYRKFTGPGFALVAGEVAFVVNAAAWLLAFLIVRVALAINRRRATT